MANATPRPLYPRERPVTHNAGSWLGLRSGLDRCGKFRPHREFFFHYTTVLLYILLCYSAIPRNDCSVVQFLVVVGLTRHVSLRYMSSECVYVLPARMCSQLSASVFFGHFTPVRCSPLVKMMAMLLRIRSPGHPARSESLYRLRYPCLYCQS